MSFLIGCGTTSSDDMPFLGVCPPWPAAGANVAIELERVPFKGWTQLAILQDEAQILREHSDSDVKAFMVFYIETMGWMKPNDGFEHFWGWIDNLYDLKEQLDICR